MERTALTKLPGKITFLAAAGRLTATAILCHLINLLLFVSIPDSWYQQLMSDLSFYREIPTVSLFVLGVVFAPAIETLAQSIPSYILDRPSSTIQKWLYIFGSGFIFAALHVIGNSWVYGLIVLPGSLALSYTYWYFHQREQAPYLMTAVLHGMYNLISLILMELFI